MAISINQQVDFLWKKLGFGVAKTELPSKKDATNESVASPPFLPGDKIWTNSHLIPAVIPTLSSGEVQIHSQATNSAVECVMDVTSTTNRTWFTNLSDWIPVEFGSTYQVKVFIAPASSSLPESNGVRLYAAGTNNDDEWYFDYASGVLHFIGSELPAQNWSGKKIYICGARYVGLKGLGELSAATIGNITITGSTISSTSELTLLSSSSNINVSGATIQNLAYPTLPTDAATSKFVTDTILALHPNTIYQGDSILRLSDPTGNAGILTLSIDGNIVLTADRAGATVGQVTINGDTVSSLGDIVISPAADRVVTTPSTTAWQLPTGTTSERPLTPGPGYTRFNITSGSLEWFNGTEWTSPNLQIDSQVIVGDEITDTFDLTHATYENNILVIIQGVTQVPGVAYTVSGSTITFAEPPRDEERIEIRYISQSVTPVIPVGQIGERTVVSPDTVIVGVTPTIIDSFPIVSYQSAKYLISVVLPDGNSQLVELLVAHNGSSGTVTTLLSTELTGESAEIITYKSQIALGACEILATSSINDTKIKVQRTYIAR